MRSGAWVAVRSCTSSRHSSGVSVSGWIGAPAASASRCVQERGTTGEPATEPDAPSARPTSNQSGGDDMSTYGQEYGGQGYGDYGGQGSGHQQLTAGPSL